MGGKKSKKSKKKAQDAGEEVDREQVRDELMALSAIFADDLTVQADDAFALRVVPHPGEVEINYVSVRLEVRCADALSWMLPPHPLSATPAPAPPPKTKQPPPPPPRRYPRRYPQEELQLRLTDPQGLEPPEVNAVAKELHLAAAAFATQGEVCCFQIIQLCQELLQERNIPPREESEGPAAPASLWEEMQQRRVAALEASSFGRSATPPLEAVDWGDGGLFGDADVAWPAGISTGTAQQQKDGPLLRPPPRKTPAKQASGAPAAAALGNRCLC